MGPGHIPKRIVIKGEPTRLEPWPWDAMPQDKGLPTMILKGPAVKDAVVHVNVLDQGLL